jgi:hypothetical protein
MNRILLASASFLIAASGNARAGINFTPTINRYTSEGAEYATAQFKDDQKLVSIGIPRTWNCRGNAARLQLVPPNQAFAEGVVEEIATKGPRQFDEASVKVLEQSVLASLPPGSQSPSVISRQENPVLLNQNPSYEFVLSYQNLGQAFLRSVIIVNCPDRQLVFKFSAPKAAFADLNRSFRQSICSWEWTDPAASKAAVRSQSLQAIAVR